MADALRLLHTPLGLPGSGRVRYGAAMELYGQGVITEAQLDAYREASPHDRLDPGSLLKERLLPAVPEFEETPSAALQILFEAARDHLLALSHAGAADVRAGLARCTQASVLVPGRSNPVIGHWLEPALCQLRTAHPQLAAAIAQAAPHLGWITYDGYPRHEIGAGFADGHAFAPIAGSNAPFRAQDFELGVFLIAPNLLYRDHCHAAPELYAPLTGPHAWRFGPDRPLIVKAAGEPVWNEAFQPHLTKVGPTPFLCLYAWTRDVQQVARVISANDWDRLEALRL